MRRAMSVIATGVLVIAVAAVAGAGGPPLRSSHVVHREMSVRHDPAVVQAVQNLSSVYTAKELEEGVYVGSEMCLACHQDQEYQNWRDTNHAQSLRKPMVQYALVQGMGTSCDSDGNGVDDFIQGLDFNQISSGFDAYKPNAPKLSVEDGTYYVTIGDVKMPVVFINGGVGRWRERYAVRIPVTDRPTGYSDEGHRVVDAGRNAQGSCGNAPRRGGLRRQDDLLQELHRLPHHRYPASGQDGGG